MAKTIDQISVFLENKPNTLNNLLHFLEQNQINIYALNISETDRYGVCRLIIKDSQKVAELIKNNGYIVSLSPVFIVPVSNKPGSLKSLINTLSKNNINIEYMYSMVYADKDEVAYMCISVNDVDLAQDVFDKNNIELFYQ